MSKRTWLALLAATMVSIAPACGDDDGDGDENTDGENTDGDDNDGDDNDGDDNDGDEGECPDHPNVEDKGTYCEISGDITEDLTLAPIEGKAAWALSGGVTVGEDVGGDDDPDSGAETATLTIEPGTQILGADNLSFLLISRGSKIMAEGEKDNPIVFTSGQPEPAPGDWGGLVINGRATHIDGTEVAGEAGTGEYGGPDDEDNSGKLKYVRVEFGGGKIDDENELNGIAFQGVGSGTEVDYVHVHANDDDGVEFFGGTVNASHLIVTGVSDDSIDWTSGWRGMVQFAIVQQWTDGPTSDPNGIEADNDGDAPNNEPISAPTFSNLTLVGDNSLTNSFGMKLRRGTQGMFYSTLVLDFADACLQVDGSESAGYVGEELAIMNSRIFCDTMFADGNDSEGAAQAMFEASETNATLESADVLEDAFSKTEPDFSPKNDDDGLLTGGAVPSDDFFEEVDFIGAVGEDDWTDGEWFKLP